MSRFEYTLTIREFHLDTFGHVNNATYLSLYEEARWELITQGGFGLQAIRKLGMGPVILECRIKFMKELLLRESITIHTKLLEYKGKIGRLEQTMLGTDQVIKSQAEFTFGLFDLKARKLISATPEWSKAIGA